MVQQILPDFSRVRVLVVGDLMLDSYWHGPTERISPEAPVPVVQIQDRDCRPGGAGNVALNLRALGASTRLLALVGEDDAAERLESQLAAAGIQTQLERVADSATIIKLRVISRNQQLIRLDFEDGFTDYDHARLLAQYEALLEQCDLVVCSDYGKGTLDEIQCMIQLALRANKPILVDPKGPDFQRYAGASLITPNESELAQATGGWEDDDEMLVAARKLCADSGLKELLVTRGDQGMILISEDETQKFPTRAQEVFDVTGAGDTVIATLALALGTGKTLADATHLANLAAGNVVSKLGTATCSTRELKRALIAEEVEETGVIRLHALKHQLQEAHLRGERVVMTNGCFDILHAGHVQYLEQARALGDRLVVAVNTDESVARLKGPERPINPLDQRMAVLSGLASVDWVVAFGRDSVDDTPRDIICELLPDILVKGGDYSADQIAGADCVMEAGGEVVVLDFVDGCSTSRIVERIRQEDRP